MQKSGTGKDFLNPVEAERVRKANSDLNFVEPPAMTGSIKEFKIEHINGKEKIFFVIDLSYNGTEWSIKRRYSDFEELMKNLRFHFFSLPALPGKSLFAVSKVKDIEERKQKLNEWIKLVMIRDEFFANDKFIQFFEADVHAASKLLNKICLVGRLTHTTFGYRDVLILEHADLMFTLTSQMQASTRIDSYITNAMGGRSNKNGKDHKMSISALECWVQRASGAEEFTYQQNWVVPFKTQAITLHFCADLNLLLVGCDNGDIVPIQVNLSESEEFT